MTKPGVMSILLRRKRFILTTGVIMAILAFAMSRVLPLDYSSEGSLIVENRPSANGEGDTSPTAISNVLTQVDVLQSKGLVEKVITALDLVHSETLKPASRLPFDLSAQITQAEAYMSQLRHYIDATPDNPTATELDQTVEYVQKHLGVNAKDNSSVITVAFTAGSPLTAAKVANAVMTTYLSTIGGTRDSQIAKTNQWINDQTDLRSQELGVAEAKLNRYIQDHNTAMVQGSSTAAIQLSHDQEELVKARELLAQKTAAMSTLQHGGSINAAQETLDSKTVQALRELQVKVEAQIGQLTTIDPRRGPLMSSLAAINAQLAAETGNIKGSLQREVLIAQAHVAAIERSISEETTAAQNSSIADATLKQLQADVDAKRQLYVAFLSDAAQERARAEQTPMTHILFTALPPQKPTHSFGFVSLVVGLLGGTLGAAGFILLRTNMSLRINTTGDLTEVTGLPMFGSLPETRRGNLLAGPQTAVTETFRAFWFTMHKEANSGSVVLVTSSDSGEGKTTVATAMARRYADDGHRVLLMEADLRRPQLASVLKLRPVVDLESVLRGETTMDQAIQVINGLHCLPAGKVSNPVQVLSSKAFGDFIGACRQTYDFVIIDSPPVLRVIDAVIMAQLCQHIVFVVQAGRLPIELVSEAISRFATDQRHKMYTLLTRVRKSRMEAGDYFSGYS